MQLLEQVEQVLDSRVRPSLFSHGGDIRVLEVEEGVLRFSLLGRCSGCPSADLTTEQLISEEVTREIPEIRKVILVNQTDGELMETVRRILAARKKIGS